MTGVSSAIVASPAPSALDHYAAPLRAVLADEAVTDLCLQSPGVGFVSRHGRWERLVLPFASFAWCTGFARLVAASTQQSVDGERPLLSASLPTGERIQVVMPPATEAGCIAITVRRAARKRWTLEELVGVAGVAGNGEQGGGGFGEGGCGSGMGYAVSAAVGVGVEDQGLDSQGELFGRTPTVVSVVAGEAAMTAACEAGDWVSFLRAAVRARKNILVSGATGSGKTTLTNALIAEIPASERLVVIEDAAELVLERHPNAVRLLYSKDGQGLSKGLTAKRLLEASLRLRPDRILLAELRGEEAYDYLRSVNSGHPGSITSIHASSPELALRQLNLLVRESVAGRALAGEEIRELVSALVDVVVQCGVVGVGGRREVEEIVWRK